MNQRIKELKDDWEHRQRRLGLTKRAVLFKRFPGWLNGAIHRRHVSFIVQNCPRQATSLLDVGCGYGRISAEVKERFPDMAFQGVDICAEFAAAYERNVGPCFNGSIQEFQPDSTYDVILVVTLLMYLDKDEHSPTLRRLWSLLSPGGTLICIEPAIEILELWRRLTGTASASPTGGEVYHFKRSELKALIQELDRASVSESDSVCLLPFVSATALHHAIAGNKAKKTSS